MNRRREAIAQELFAERGGREALSVIARFQVMEYAALSVQLQDTEAYLDHVGNLTAAGQQRAAVRYGLDIAARRERVGALLQDRDPIETRAPAHLSGLATMHASALVRAQLLLERQERGGLLSERELGQLDILQAAMTGEVLLAGPVAGPHDATDLNKPGGAPTCKPDNSCIYCGCSCIGREHPAFRTLHWNDPEEMERRRQEQTAVMKKTLGKGSPYL